jgi:RNA polymerase sigma-70 factor (ECF subfamily)
MTAVALGDRAAFEQIVIAYRLPGIAFAASITGDVGIAEDIVQDCFVKLWLHRTDYDVGQSRHGVTSSLTTNERMPLEAERKPIALQGGRRVASFKTYLFTLIRNAAIDDRRRRKTERMVSDLLSVSANDILSDASAESVFIGREQRALMVDIFRELPGDRRAMLYLFAVEDLSYKEIAKVMKKTTGQVKITIYRARTQLKKQIEISGGFDDEE